MNILICDRRLTVSVTGNEVIFYDLIFWKKMHLFYRNYKDHRNGLMFLFKETTDEMLMW